LDKNSINKQNENQFLVETLVKKTNECYQLKKDLEAVRNMESLYKRALDDANQALNERTVQYKQVVSSRSWKITSVVRNIYTILKHIRGKRLHVRRKINKLLVFGTLLANPSRRKDFINYKKQNGIVAAVRQTNEILSKYIDHELVYGDIIFSVIMPVYNVNVRWLEKAIESVKNQSYKNWELCIVDDASTHVEVKSYLQKINDEKIKILLMEENGGISKATNAAMDISTGSYIVLLDNDDELSVSALLECYKVIKKDQADIIYSDQDIITESGEHLNPLYKPDWSPDLLFCQMYLGHLVCFCKKLFTEVGGFRSEFNGSQDYDLLLRMIEKTSNIKHISKVLYSWRALASSTAMNPGAKPYAQTAGLKALQEHFDRAYGEGYATVRETENLFVYDVRYHLLQNQLISIIIPTKDHADDLKVTIESIQNLSTYKNYEIIILNNRSEEESTFEYFKVLEEENKNIQIVVADCGFNWSMINNIGIRKAKGDIFIFLNNDVKIISPDWLERLGENALREEIGVVGGLLLYDDGTIQHGGIVVGYGSYADHVYKGMWPEHIGTPYISPCVNRNVLAVTGACMAISREKLDAIGIFNENYIICGSDVELCIRAYKNGYYNLYTPFVQLYHYESKSRGSYVPENDLYLSQHLYAEFLEKGDPYYNSNLSYQSCVPVPLGTEYSKGDNGTDTRQGVIEVSQPEITPMHFRKIEYSSKRVNIILPSINKRDMFGGIATALSFFNAFVEESGWDSRIIISDAAPDAEAVKNYTPAFMFCDSSEDVLFPKQIVAFSDRWGKTLAISDHDYFIFTGWWTAYCIQEEYLINAERLQLKQNPFLYLIQDFEPGFYPWSSQYMFAELTYKTRQDQYAIFNSGELKDYFLNHGYLFKKTFVFNPLLNTALRNALPQEGEYISKKKQILVYGRPSTARNAFVLLVEVLKKWVEIQPEVSEWKILSAGETFEPVNLGNGQSLISVGKLSIEDYAQMLKDTYAGVSIMVSPHPSYPPLEMSVYGVQVITNRFANKDMNYFNKNIHSIDNIVPMDIARLLNVICDNYEEEYIFKRTNPEYCEGNLPFPFITEILRDISTDERK